MKSAFKKLYKELIRYLNHRNSIVLKVFYSFFWKPKQNSISLIFSLYSKKFKPVKFLQIGANDGMEHDPVLKFIRRDHWHGILIEPQNQVYKKLHYLHANTPGITLVNAAISQKNEKRELYKISFSDSRWATGISSFVKETLIEQIESGYVDECARREGLNTPENKEDYISSDRVECIDFTTLSNKYLLNNIKLLQIDTEGFDSEIIKMLDFKSINPDIISFEISHTSDNDSKEVYEILHSRGYKIYEKGRDACAVKAGLIEEVNGLEEFNWQ